MERTAITPQILSSPVSWQTELNSFCWSYSTTATAIIKRTRNLARWSLSRWKFLYMKHTNYLAYDVIDDLTRLVTCTMVNMVPVKVVPKTGTASGNLWNIYKCIMCKCVNLLNSWSTHSPQTKKVPKATGSVSMEHFLLIGSWRMNEFIPITLSKPDHATSSKPHIGRRRQIQDSRVAGKLT